MLKQRVLTAVVAVVLLLLVLYPAPTVLTRAVIAALFLAAAWEWSGFLSPRSTPVRLSFLALIALSELVLFVVLPALGLYQLLAIVAALWWSTALVWLFLFPTGISQWVVWLCGALVLLPAYAALDWLFLQSPHFLLALLVIVWSADIGAYFAGRALGRVKLAPEVSPGKTWEGVAGGLLAVAVVISVGTPLAGLPLLSWLSFGAAVALLSVVGDLTVSMFKRHSGVKDSGRLFPGHGGILDRIDSVCAAAPLFAVGVAIMGPSQ